MVDNTAKKNFLEGYHGLTKLLETNTLTEGEYCFLTMELNKRIMRGFIEDLGLNEEDYYVSKQSILH